MYDSFATQLHSDEMTPDYQPTDSDLAELAMMDDSANRSLPINVVETPRGIRCLCPNDDCPSNDANAPLYLSPNRATRPNFCGQCGTGLDWTGVEAECKRLAEKARRLFWVRKRGN